MAVIPAKAEALFNSKSWSIHLRFLHQSNMDSRFRGNDGKEEYVSLQVIGRLLLIAKPIWS